MSPTIDRREGFVFYFHSFDIFEGRPSVHVGVGSHGDDADAKVWLDDLTVQRQGLLSNSDLRKALRIVTERQRQYRETWYEHERRSRRK